MLVIGRKVGDKINIGEGANMVELTVIAISGGQVRLGLEADRSVPINRSEIDKDTYNK